MRKTKRIYTDEAEIAKICRKLNRAEKRKPVLSKIIGVGTTGFFITVLAQLSNRMPDLGAYLMQSLSNSAGVAVGEIAGSVLANTIQRRRDKFFNVLINYDGYLTPETISSINSSQFILEYAKTIDVIDRLARDEKINFIANLFGKYFIKEHHEEVDFYEECLHQLSSLSYREIDMMITLYQLEADLEAKNNERGRHIDADAIAKGSVCTDQLKEIAPGKWSMDEGELIGILTSLCGSGFVREVVGAYVGYTGEVFYTTPYLKKFLSYILDME